jgi:hypothetical protein
MKSLFRSIRQKLLGEGKLLRYLTYAVGEVILIIVGILFALKINNWNEDRKDRQVELSILEEIHGNLQNDLRIFNRAINQLQDAEISCKSLLSIVENDLAFDESYGYYLTYLSVFPRFDSNTSGYQLLKTKGLELIRDNELRQAFTNLYEVRYQTILCMEAESKESRKSDVRSALKKYHGPGTLTGDGSPDGLTINQRAVEQGLYRPMNNFDAFKKDSEFHWVIRDIASTTLSELARYERHRSTVEDLIARLEEDLN